MSMRKCMLCCCCCCGLYCCCCCVLALVSAVLLLRLDALHVPFPHRERSSLSPFLSLDDIGTRGVEVPEWADREELLATHNKEMLVVTKELARCKAAHAKALAVCEQRVRDWEGKLRAREEEHKEVCVLLLWLLFVVVGCTSVCLN